MSLEFHHIGVACRNLDLEANRLADLGYRLEGSDFSDEVQGVTRRFLVGGGPRLELLVSNPSRSILEPWLRTGAKFYHLAYETTAFADELRRLRVGGAKTVVSPVASIAFAGRKIAFLLLPTMVLVELIEK